MKFIKFIVISIFSILIFACSNNTPSKIISADENNLRDAINNKEKSVKWTSSLDEDRLSENIAKYEEISGNVILSTDLMMVINKNTEKVYPYLENFENLNDSELQLPWINKVKLIIDALNTDVYSCPEEIFENKFIFNYVFFVNDLKDKWKENFGIEFNNDNSISKYLYGEPCVCEDIVQIPVKLFTEKGSVNIIIYLKNEQDYLINQIEINGWEVNL